MVSVTASQLTRDMVDPDPVAAKAYANKSVTVTGLVSRVIGGEKPEAILTGDAGHNVSAILANQVEGLNLAATAMQTFHCNRVTRDGDNVRAGDCTFIRTDVPATGAP